MSTYCPVPLPSEVPPKPMYITQIIEDYQNAFKNIMQMLKDPRYQNKSRAFLKIFAPQPCEQKKYSAYNKSEFNLDENPRWEVPPEEDNQNTEVYGNEFYAPVYIDQFANQLSTPCNNYYESLAEDDDMSDDEMDAYDEEMYKEFEDEVEQEDEMLFYPQEPSRMPPGFTKSNTQDTIHIKISAGQDQPSTRNTWKTSSIKIHQTPIAVGISRLSKQDHIFLNRQIIALFLSRQIINKSVLTFQVNTWTITAVFGNEVYRSISE